MAFQYTFQCHFYAPKITDSPLNIAFFVAGYGSGDDYFWSLKICNAATARVFVVMPLPSATVSSCNCRKNGARGDAANDAAKN
ncbi:hypothetical protein WN944_013005 [Citrus x changshan-huyou]|uniref:Uncharacterized protein n=1 Tax=Citrus x changshan-huyou TaxID=2935761 RepID=A0AAP0M4B7_9ROSI